MFKKVLIFLSAVFFIALLFFYAIGRGWFGSPWSSQPVVDGPRPLLKMAGPEQESAVTTSQVLFGDLHNHTSYSIDAYLFSTNAGKGGGVQTPADACDFARYCSALDFWSINDHAESLTPRAWANTVAAIRDCNARAGDPANPDMVSFPGWEWSNGSRDDVPSHYGHKNVIFRSWDQGEVPVRPISSQAQYVVTKVPAPLIGAFSLSEGIAPASDLGWYLTESKSVSVCPDDVASPELPSNCREVALTPTSLYRKLSEWGFDSMVIPHGLSWGTTNPLASDFKDQLDEHEQRYQKLLEVYSGHGSSERFDPFTRITEHASGERSCPEATDNFLPCCQQAGVIARSQCDQPYAEQCEQQVQESIDEFLKLGVNKGRRMFPDSSLSDWQGCGQLLNSFQPSSRYIPRMSAQYNLALGFDENGKAKRAKFGLIGSSDGHQARPGSSYKENNRVLYTDHKGVGGDSLDFNDFKPDRESGAFYYTGGLVAVHAEGRDKDAIWAALDNRNVYATSGDRIKVWFDLLNGPNGEAPMGSEVIQSEAPRFRVKAVGAMKQKPGCPEYSVKALGQARVDSLCGGECYHPSDELKRITRIEVVRIRPQVHPDETVAPLIENDWRVFDCPAKGEGCVVEFDDPDFEAGKRSTLYYARVIQEPEALIGGDPFGCEYDAQGECIKRTYCVGSETTPDNNCLAEAEPRAWSSPIFVDYR